MDVVETKHVSGIGTIFLSATIGLALLACWLLLGAGFSLFSVHAVNGVLGLDEMTALALVGLCFGIIGAFFVGGFFSTRGGAPRNRADAAWRGFAVWAAASLFVLTLGGWMIASELSKIQISMGAAANAEAMLSGLSEMNVRFVSDLKILKGKAVTELSMEKPKDRIVRKTAAELRALGTLAGDTALQNDKRLTRVSEENRQSAARAALTLFLGLLAAAVGSIAGALLGASRKGSPAPVKKRIPVLVQVT